MRAAGRLTTCPSPISCQIRGRMSGRLRYAWSDGIRRLIASVFPVIPLNVSCTASESCFCVNQKFSVSLTTPTALLSVHNSALTARSQKRKPHPGSNLLNHRLPELILLSYHSTKRPATSRGSTFSSYLPRLSPNKPLTQLLPNPRPLVNLLPHRILAVSKPQLQNYSDALPELQFLSLPLVHLPSLR